MMSLIFWNNWKGGNNKMKCLNCDVDNDYVCFECESIFIKENYPNYFYNDDCEWELKKEVA
jgi:hypothetical protein